MYIARILYPVEVLGYGKRIGIWFVGCPHKCNGCSNPELWKNNPKYEIALNNLIRLILDICAVNEVDGFTISGGEPFYQSKDLLSLITELNKINDDILVYSGYTLEELKAMQNIAVNSVLDRISVLIDGRYIENQNNDVTLRGSDNQKIYILNPKYQLRYDNYIKNAVNAIQNFNSYDGIISIGIHHPNFKSSLNTAVSKKGLVDKNE